MYVCISIAKKCLLFKVQFFLQLYSRLFFFYLQFYRKFWPNSFRRIILPDRYVSHVSPRKSDEQRLLLVLLLSLYCGFFSSTNVYEYVFTVCNGA